MVNDIDVRHLIVAANVINFAGFTCFKNAADGRAVVFYVEPVADLLSVPVNGERFSGERVVDDERDEFFGEVVGSVVIGAVGGEDGESVGVVIGSNEVIAGGFAGRVRAVRHVAVGFGEGGIGGFEGAVDFVR